MIPDEMIWEQRRIKEKMRAKKRCEETRDAHVTSCDLWTHGRMLTCVTHANAFRATHKSLPKQPSASIQRYTTLNLLNTQCALDLMIITQPLRITCSSGSQIIFRIQLEDLSSIFSTSCWFNLTKAQLIWQLHISLLGNIPDSYSNTSEEDRVTAFDKDVSVCVFEALSNNSTIFPCIFSSVLRDIFRFTCH